MFFLFCSKYDYEAIWLYNQVALCHDIESYILFSEDLYQARDWTLRVNDNDSFAKVVLQDDTEINNKNVKVFFNRVRDINHPFWQKMNPVEKDYFQQEWSAFFTGWLKAFEPALINTPAPAMLAGYQCWPIRWSILAAEAGLKIKPLQYDSADENTLDHLLFENREQLTSVLIFKNKIYGPPGTGHVATACLELAKKVKCQVLEVFFERGNDNKLYFVSANSMPSFSYYPAKFVEVFKLETLKKTGSFHLV